MKVYKSTCVYQKSKRKACGVGEKKQNKKPDAICFRCMPCRRCRYSCRGVAHSSERSRSNRSKDKQIADMIETSNSQLQLIGALTMKNETLLLETKKSWWQRLFSKNSLQLVEHIEMLFCKT